MSSVTRALIWATYIAIGLGFSANLNPALNKSVVETVAVAAVWPLALGRMLGEFVKRAGNTSPTE